MTPPHRRRTAILISGRGSNMSALIAAARAADFPAEIVLVLSNRPDAPGLGIAKAAGVAVAAVDHKIYAGREEFERTLQVILETHRIDLICLAGFMRLLTPWFVGLWRGRMLNIHPSLLPAFRGTQTHERALAEGVRLHGCTVHFVEPELDSGPIVIQAAIPVLDSDDAASLATRVIEQEHLIYPRALELVAASRTLVAGNRVRLIGKTDAPGKGETALVSPPLTAFRG